MNPVIAFHNYVVTTLHPEGNLRNTNLTESLPVSAPRPVDTSCEGKGWAEHFRVEEGGSELKKVAEGGRSSDKSGQKTLWVPHLTVWFPAG